MRAQLFEKQQQQLLPRPVWMPTLLAYLRYLRTVVWHKTCIVAIGCWVNWRLRGSNLRVSLSRLLFHDWVKFLPAEFVPYATYYSYKRDGAGDPPQAVRDAFQRAYAHHYKRMDHHWEHHVIGYDSSMSPDQIAANARPMPAEAVVEVVVDALAAQYSYEGSWPPSDWSRLARLSVSYQHHPSALALLCAVWHCVGFHRPLFSMQDGAQHGWPVAASMVAAHPPYVALFQSLREADQQARLPLSASIAYLARLCFHVMLIVGLPLAPLCYYYLRRRPSAAGLLEQHPMYMSLHQVISTYAQRVKKELQSYFLRADSFSHDAYMYGKAQIRGDYCHCPVCHIRCFGASFATLCIDHQGRKRRTAKICDTCIGH